MTQKELIQKVKEELGKNFNENASFLVTQPFFKENTLGLKKDELINGIYVTLLDQNKAPMFEGNIYYFKVIDPEQYCKTLYNTQYKKYMFPLSKIGDWSTLIGNDVRKFPLTPEQCFTAREYERQLVEKMQAQDEREALKEEQFKTIVEEFPIQKIQGKTTYRKRDSFIILENNTDKENYMSVSVFENKMVLSKQKFSDLVDLMIEARKDLLK